jgi:hypothetical protein
VSNKVQYIKNNKQMFQSYSKYNSYKNINDDEIVIILDGDDWLARSDALNIIANTYMEQKCLVAYSGYIIYNKTNIFEKMHSIEYSDKIKNNSLYRKSNEWFFSHIRTGYAKLFKKIPIEYFKYKNKWLDRCTDWAEMYSIAELAGNKVSTINKFLYIYNKSNSIKYKNSYFNDYYTNERKNIEEYIKKLIPLNIYYQQLILD